MIRIKKLRQLFESRNIDGFLLNRANCYNYEYLLPHEERLEWLSGFTGSAGELLVLKNKTVIFVDGRYLQQAKQELADQSYEIVPVSDFILWCNQNLIENITLGFDPLLYKVGKIESMQNGLADNINLSAIDNLVDAIWQRPNSLISKTISKINNTYTGLDYQIKLDNFFVSISKDGYDYIIITSTDSLSWLFNIRNLNIPYNHMVGCHAIVSSKIITLYIDGVLVDSIRDKRVVTKNIDTFIDDLQTITDKKVIIDKQNCGYNIYQILLNNNCVVTHKPDPLSLPKACKNNCEINGSIASHIRDGEVFTKVLYWIDQCINNSIQITEQDVVYKFFCLRALDPLFISESFPTIAAAGVNAAICHYQPNDNNNAIINNANILLVDAGVQSYDGTTDATRTIVINEKLINYEIKRDYTNVLKGHIALATVKFPFGVCGFHIDALARQFLWANNMDYAHATGHGVGHVLSVHEGPQSISPAVNQINLLPGMILSNEPGYYKEDSYGIRIENCQYIEKYDDKFLFFKSLTKIPLEKRLIDKSILSEQEINWINLYHQDVYNSLHKSFVDNELEWLKQITSKI